MYSKIVPFQDIIQAVKDETGIENLRNLYPKISRLIYRIEKDIGFGYGMILKKVNFSKEEETIIERRIKLPDDLVIIEAIGTDDSTLDPSIYAHQGNFLFFHADISSIDLVYYTMLCDGEGFPAVTENHFDAVVAGVKYYMYQPKVWNGEGSAQLMKYLQEYYFARLGEAIGNDVMPSTDLEWSQIAQHVRMSYRDILLYSKEQSYEGAPLTSLSSGDAASKPVPVNATVYDWQYTETTSSISDAVSIDQAFLDSKQKSSLVVFSSGKVISYTAVGRVALAIQNIDINKFRIQDLFGADITEIVFDNYYNVETRTQIYISKDVFAFGNIFYKITNS